MMFLTDPLQHMDRNYNSTSVQSSTFIALTRLLQIKKQIAPNDHLIVLLDLFLIFARSDWYFDSK